MASVTGPDGRKLQFPDGTDPAVVMQVLQQQYPDADWGGAQQQPKPRITPKAPSDAELARMAYDDSPSGIKAWISAGSEFKALARGLGQLVTPNDSAIHKALTASADADRPFSDAPHGAENLAGRAIPYLATIPLGGPEAAVVSRLPQGASLLARIGARAIPAAVEGAVYGGAREVRTGESRGQNAALGAAGGLAARGATGAVGAGVRGTRNALATLRGVSNADRAAVERLLAEADDPNRLTRPAPSAVPGVQRDLAEESRDPGIARLSRTLRSTQPGFTDIDLANNAARVKALEPIAGTDADMAAAEAARDSSTAALRDRAFAEGAATAEQNQQARALALGSPTDDGIGRLRSAVSGIAAQHSSRPSVQSALNDVSRALDKAGDSVGGLYGVRQYIGDLLSGKAGADKGYAKAASGQLIHIRDLIDEELTRRAPTFADYLTAFRDQSKPINRMEVGRDLLSPSSGGATQDALGNQVLTPAQFSKKARDLDAVAARATGFAKAKAEDILKPADIATIKAIQDDLERQAFRQTAGSGGNSQTFERLATQGRIAKRGASAVLGSLPVVGRFAGDLLDALERSKNARVQERLAYLVANPSEARRVLAALSPAGQSIVSKALADASRIAGQRAITSATISANSNKPLELNIVGGRVGPAVATQQELDAWKADMAQNGAAAGY